MGNAKGHRPSAGGGAGGMSQGELDALEAYVSGEGMWINDYLRGRVDKDTFGELRPNEKDYLSDLEKATDKGLKEGQVLYRSVDAEAIFGDMSGLEFSNLESYLVHNERNKFATATANKYLKNAEGKTIHDKGFVSTTKNYDVAADWYGFTGSDHPIVLEMHTGKKTRGVDVAKANKRLEVTGNEQHEVLLHNNSKYKVRHVGARDGQIYVKVDLE